jgi:RHS repeat-associated protein
MSEVPVQRLKLGGSLAQTGLPQVLSSATYDAANELTQWDATNLTYDDNGSLTADGANNYTWNARNQLTTVKDASTGATLANFQYDAFGRRTENAAGDGVLYDGVNAVQELSGTTPVVNRLTGGVDEFFGRTDSGGTTFPLTDALGSTIALTDSSGAIQTQYTYEPFGATTVTGATSSNWYQFTGRANDGTGLYYYRARYYSPRFQRFISEGPAGIAGGINFYAYAGNSPVNFGDPFGLKPNGCQSILCSPLFWGGLALAVAAPEALPLEWAAGAEAAGEGAEAAEAMAEAAGQDLVVNLGGEGEVPEAINVQGPWALENDWAASASGQSLSQLQAAGNQFVVANNTALPFADGSVNTVITNNVPIEVNTWLGPGAQSSEIWRILAPGGTWINNGMVVPLP